MDTNDSRITIPCLTTDEAILVLLSSNTLDDLTFSSASELEKYQKWSERILRTETDIGCTSTVNERISTWFMGDEFRHMDVHKFLLDKCTTDEEVTRVNHEYSMFEERDLIMLLRLLIYLVDHFRTHKYVWGVGRGSSVASFCLYLIGINKINPLVYDLDIDEFLK